MGVSGQEHSDTIKRQEPKNHGQKYFKSLTGIGQDEAAREENYKLLSSGVVDHLY